MLTNFCQGGYPNSLHYLFAVSHSTDNIIQVLDIDDGDETEDYNVDDYLQTSSPSSFAQTISNSDNLCEICWNTQRERDKAVVVPCGHSRFCQACADKCFGSADKKMCGMQIKNT